LTRRPSLLADSTRKGGTPLNTIYLIVQTARNLLTVGLHTLLPPIPKVMHWASTGLTTKFYLLQGNILPASTASPGLLANQKEASIHLSMTNPRAMSSPTSATNMVLGATLVGEAHARRLTECENCASAYPRAIDQRGCSA
jgi:hypothetical protein